jgi:radical SAM superfamily enzyme YgiQ (UPF0313 family)
LNKKQKIRILSIGTGEKPLTKFIDAKKMDKSIFYTRKSEFI